jgi:perosamine synthetase
MTSPIEHPREWPVYTAEAVARASELVAAGRTFDYAYGPEIEGLEAAFEDRYGRRALALNSGTSALLAAYFALGIRSGDEVVVPTYTFYSTATPLLLLGAMPVLCDAGRRNGNVSAESIEPCLTDRTRAVVVTHLYGWPCEIDPIMDLCRRRGVAVIEDCSHAHGSKLDGREVGTFGDLAVFSIGGQKMVSGGLGGILLASSQEHYEIACLLGNFRPRSRHSVSNERLRGFVETGLGGNLRISPIAALLATSHLNDLDGLVATKSANVRRLLDGLRELPGVEVEADGCVGDNGAWYGVNVQVAPDIDVDGLIRRQGELGLRVRRPATVPLHHRPLFSTDGPPTWASADQARWIKTLGDRQFPVAETTYQRSIAYPATFLHDRDGIIVEPYVESTALALSRANRTAISR